VNNPIARLTVMMRPKCTGSMPMDVTMGTSSGLSSKMAEIGSTRQPAASSETLTTSNNTQVDTSKELIHDTAAAGIWLTVSTQLNTLALATMIRIWDVNMAVPRAIR